MAGMVLSPQRAELESLLGGRMLPPGANAGLIFERYLSIWEQTAGGSRLGGSGQPSISRFRERELQDALAMFVVDFDGARTQQEPHLKALQARWDRLEQSEQGGMQLISGLFQLESALALGLGAEHPLENSLTFDPLLGVPFIPGSAVKGLLRAQARALDLKAEVLDQLFGPDRQEDDEEPASTGDLICYPAWPQAWPELMMELINNHHPGYYEDQRLDRTQNQPDGTESPVPVFLLMVRPGKTAQFRFRLGSRSAQRETLEVGMELLRIGLQLLGMGSKTESGYGRFKPVQLPTYRVQPVSSGDPVLVFEGMIGSIPGRILPSEVKAALGTTPIKREFRLNMLSSTNVPDVHAYQWSVTEKLEALVRELRAWTLHNDYTKLHVFGFASIPMLMKLGALLADKGPTQLYQRHSDTDGWSWPGDETPLDLTIREPGERYRSTHVVVMLNVSGENDPSLGRSAVRNAWGADLGELEVYRLQAAKPSRNVVKHPKHVHEYRVMFRQLLQLIQDRHGPEVQVHLFPALPLPFAIETGRSLIQSDPALHVYERRSGQEGFAYALKLTEKGPDSPDVLRVRKVLVLAPVVADETPLQQHNELRELGDARQRGTLRDRYELILKPGATLETLKDALMVHRPAILHFTAHGSPSKGLLFQKAEGATDRFSPEELATLLELTRPSLECVVLNACSTIESARAIKPHVKVAIGTTETISDEAGRAFARGFFRAVFNGKGYPEAFEHGVAELSGPEQAQRGYFKLLT